MLNKLIGYLSIWNRQKQPHHLIDFRTVSGIGETLHENLLGDIPLFSKVPAPIWFSADAMREMYTHKKILKFNYPSTECLIVLYRGNIIHEEYAFGFNSHTKFKMYSMTKSVVATLLCIAIAEGFIKSDREIVAKFFPEIDWNLLPSSKRQMTLEHLLTMTSGILDGGAWRNSDNAGRAGFLRPQYCEPGKKFEYVSVNYHIIAEIIRRSVGKDLMEYANDKLFSPLGIKSVEWDSLPDGCRRGNGGIQMTAIDMAKLGHLWLNWGKWGNKQIVPANYILHMTSQFKSKYAFGQPFWNNSVFPYYLEGSFETRGHNGQFISIYPSRGLVVVRLGWPTSRICIGDPGQALAGTKIVIGEQYSSKQKRAIIDMIQGANGTIQNKISNVTSFIVSDSNEPLAKIAFNKHIPIYTVENLNRAIANS